MRDGLNLQLMCEHALFLWAARHIEMIVVSEASYSSLLIRDNPSQIS